MLSEGIWISSCETTSRESILRWGEFELGVVERHRVGTVQRWTLSRPLNVTHQPVAQRGKQCRRLTHPAIHDSLSDAHPRGARQSKEGELRIKRHLLRQVEDETSRQVLLEDLDSKKDEIVLRFGSKHSAIYPVEAESSNQSSQTAKSQPSPAPPPQPIPPPAKRPQRSSKRTPVHRRAIGESREGDSAR